MMSVAKKDEAVSPVIGTILLVAITVVLVAIVAAVVMGMVGGIGNSKTVGATATAGNGYVIGTITGGQDVGKLSNFSISISNKTSGDVKSAVTTTTDGTGSQLVGKQLRVPSGSDTVSAGQYSFTITGNFTDGTAQVLSTGTITVTP